MSDLERLLKSPQRVDLLDQIGNNACSLPKHEEAVWPLQITCTQWDKRFVLLLLLSCIWSRFQSEILKRVATARLLKRNVQYSKIKTLFVFSSCWLTVGQMAFLRTMLKPGFCHIVWPPMKSCLRFGDLVLWNSVASWTAQSSDTSSLSFLSARCTCTSLWMLQPRSYEKPKSNWGYSLSCKIVTTRFWHFSNLLP